MHGVAAALVAVAGWSTVGIEVPWWEAIVMMTSGGVGILYLMLKQTTVNASSSVTKVVGIASTIKFSTRTKTPRDCTAQPKLCGPLL